MNEGVFVINPGSTSTKVAVFDGDQELWKETISHDAKQLQQFETIASQLDFRFNQINDALPDEYRTGWVAVVGRGGLVRPGAGGTYTIVPDVLKDLLAARFGEHASNLGPLLAHRFAEQAGVPALIVDPVTTDEFGPIPRISGVPGIQRKCRSHALNIKATARRAASELGKPLADTKLVVAHMGGGISIAALDGGRIADVNDGQLGMGPFGPERAGALPLKGVLELCRDKGFDEAVRILKRESGFVGYFGTSSLIEVEDMIDAGNEEAKLVFEAMAYQIAKEIGAMATALKGGLSGIVLTGGMINSERLHRRLVEYVSFLGKVFHYPGEAEMEALAQGALRVIRGQEEARQYGSKG